MAKIIRIPEISDQEIEELLKRIKPLVRRGRRLRRIKSCDPRNIAFAWDPKFSLKPVGRLKEVRRITTYHTYGYYGCFKPSIAEVLAQIPSDLKGRTLFFEVIGPQTAADLNKHLQELHEGYHVAETILYERA